MVAPELVRRVQRNFDCGFSTLYGQTEHSPVITQHHISDGMEDVCETVGQPIAQTDVSIRTVEENQVGAIGEVARFAPAALVRCWVITVTNGRRIRQSIVKGGCIPGISGQ